MPLRAPRSWVRTLREGAPGRVWRAGPAKYRCGSAAPPVPARQLKVRATWPQVSSEALWTRGSSCILRSRVGVSRAPESVYRHHEHPLPDRQCPPSKPIAPRDRWREIFPSQLHHWAKGPRQTAGKIAPSTGGSHLGDNRVWQRDSSTGETRAAGQTETLPANGTARISGNAASRVQARLASVALGGEGHAVGISG